MDPHARARLVEALAFALEAHGAQTRKGRDIPYASHLLQVAGLVLEHGGDVELAVAALLHDTLEDCDHVDDAVIRTRFGERVVRVVVACSDLLPGDEPDTKSPWLLRKQGFLARLRDAEVDVHLVTACDKLHNLRSLLADLDAEGPATLERFTASPEQTRVYHEAVLEAVAETIPDSLHRELAAALAALARWVPESRFEDA